MAEAKKKDEQGWKYWEINESPNLYSQTGITWDGNFGLVFRPDDLRRLITFYKMALDFYGNRSIIDDLTRFNIEKTQRALYISKSPVIHQPSPNAIPNALKPYGENWHWWQEGFGIDEGGTISKIYSINTLGNCFQVLSWEQAEKLIILFAKFHEDFKENGVHSPYLKKSVEQIDKIWVISEMLKRKHLLLMSNKKQMTDFFHM